MKKNNINNTVKPFEKGFFDFYGTYIHPTSIVGENVILGENVKIGPYSILAGNIKIDSNTKLYGYVSIGMPAQDTNTSRPEGTVLIGKNTHIREFVTISSPKTSGQSTTQSTRIGNNCYIMNFSHVAHDVTMEDNVVLINNSNIGGHVHIEKNVMIMANGAIHQFCRIGAYSALAPFSGMRQDLPPYSLFNGTPGKFAGLNSIALRRANITSEEINKIKKVTKLFFQDKLSINKIYEIVNNEENLRNSKHAINFIEFIKKSSRGVSRKNICDKT